MGFHPLLSLPVDAKRARPPVILSDYDPSDQPEQFLRDYNTLFSRATRLPPHERAEVLAWLTSAEAPLMQFIADMAASSVVVGDIETTEAIKHGVSLGDMKISVATLLFQDNRHSTMLSFWHDGVARGAPLRFFKQALDHAKKLIFFNSNFDLTVAAAGDAATISRWRERTFDPYMDLRRKFGPSLRLKLDALLAVNELQQKAGSGLLAVQQWQNGEFEALELYNRRDVTALHELVSLPRIRLVDGRVTTVGTLGHEPADTRLLLQGSAEWLAARRGLLTASVAGAALGLTGAFKSREDVAARLHAELNGLSVDQETVNSERAAAMQRGIDLEPVARRAYERLFGVRVKESGLHVHADHPVLAASPDGIVGDVLLEIKVPRAKTKGRGLTDAYLVQLQLGMACTQTRKADFVVMQELGTPAGGLKRQLGVTRVARDDDLLVVIVQQLLAFHDEARRDDTPFPMDPPDMAAMRLAIRDARLGVDEELVFEILNA